MAELVQRDLLARSLRQAADSTTDRDLAQAAPLTVHEKSLLVAGCRLGQDVVAAGKIGFQALPAEVGKRHASLPACLLAVDEKRSLLGVPVGEIQANDLAPSQATAIQDAEGRHPKMTIERLTRLSGSFPNPSQCRVADASRQTMATVQSRSLHPTQGVIVPSVLGDQEVADLPHPRHHPVLRRLRPELPVAAEILGHMLDGHFVKLGPRTTRLQPAAPSVPLASHRVDRSLGQSPGGIPLHEPVGQRIPSLHWASPQLARNLPKTPSLSRLTARTLPNEGSTQPRPVAHRNREYDDLYDHLRLERKRGIGQKV